MKRLNPKTGKPFKCGDIREDNYVFWGYCLKHIKQDGFFVEAWLNKTAFEKQVKTAAKWKINNPDKKIEHDKIWNRNNRSKKNAHEAKRRSIKQQRTLPWLTKKHFDEIEEFYTIARMFQMYTGEQYHVDHIVPLKGKNVSGLHAPWNLQVLPAKENLSKNNKHGIQ